MDSNAVGPRFFINEVGQGEREEVNEGMADADCSWQCREGTRVNGSTGKCNPIPPSVVNPILEDPHGGAVLPGVTIASFMAVLGNTLDLDGDGSVNATTDGLLLLRYLLNLRGAALTTGASATNRSATDIANYVLSLLP